MSEYIAYAPLISATVAIITVILTVSGILARMLYRIASNHLAHIEKKLDDLNDLLIDHLAWHSRAGKDN